MHMADALLSPAVGGAMWVTTATLVAHSARRVRAEADDRKVPLMGVVGAFVFAVQMINFTIPGTGSSGHLGGGLLLAILLGPHAAFLTIASVLAVQALFFADGGLLALGANIFNLGAFPCFLAYPLVYRPLARGNPGSVRVTVATLLGAILGLQAGAAAVVLETVASEVSALPLDRFMALMLPIHLAIGVVEGIVTAMLINFIRAADPGVLGAPNRPRTRSFRRVLIGLGVAALLTGGGLAWFASSHPDGLEWSIAQITGAEEEDGDQTRLHGILRALQEKLAILPDYGLPGSGASQTEASDEAWPSAEPGTSLSGVVGALLTLFMTGLVGILLRRRSASAS